MTEIERKALALVTNVAEDQGKPWCIERINRSMILDESICRAIEQHEAFRKEVSDAVGRAEDQGDFGELYHLVIPKRDPLVEALMATAWHNPEQPDRRVLYRGTFEAHAASLREEITKRGGRIMFEGDGP